jgi:hypothetical protein
VNDHWAINVEAAYYWVDDSIDFIGTSNSADLNFWTLGGGLKFIF